MTKLNLGCGKKYLPGFINTEIVKSVKADKYFDLDKMPYPFQTSSIDFIRMDNVLEHLTDIPAVMRELHRILKPNGIVELFLPYAKSDGAVQDPTHKHFFTEKSMLYFSDNFQYNYYTDFRFKLLKNQLRSENKTKLSKVRLIIPLKGLLKYLLWNIYDEVYVKLQAVK